MSEKCPKCGSLYVKKNGFRITLKGRKRRYKCGECRRTFYSKKERSRLFAAKRKRKLRQKQLEYRIKHWYDEDAPVKCNALAGGEK